ncbi:aminotransferase class IV, partial [Nocardia sp. NPDC057227]|uniref:aminotransferase class IV n=1 Tax=Nocardia sp. NPDC057227 TaxID=3346056 RepID=UPI00362DF997
RLPGARVASGSLPPDRVKQQVNADTPYPEISCDILDGINRRTVLTLAAEDGIPVLERTVDLTELYIADEVFVTGTSAGAAPVLEVDGRIVGDGRPGPISQALRKRHHAALRTDDAHGWLTRLD